MKAILGMLALLMAVAVAPVGAQTASAARSDVASVRLALRDQLIPTAATLMTRGPLLGAAASEAVTVSAVRPGEGTAYMIVGLALFIAGIVADDGDASTVLLLAGAGIGGYGLYLRFR